MDYIELAQTNFKVSRICFGCMSLPSREKESSKLINKAISLGINFFDTADLYEKGENERRLAAGIKHERHNLILATKVGNKWHEDGSGWSWNPSKKYILKAVEDSLVRLQTDYIDLYQLHGGTIEDPFDETIEAFEILKTAGKIREYGISSIRPNVIREYINRSNIVSLMTQYSLLDKRPEENTLAITAENSITVLARGCLAQGLLAGKPPKPYLERSIEDVALAQELLRQFSNERTQAQSALKYVLQKNANLVAVTGIRTESQLDELVGTFNTPDLTPVELNYISKSSGSSFFYKDHR